ncbi:hypothetical protein JCM10213_000833 [Rhodosporidiobolus nylandii]
MPRSAAAGPAPAQDDSPDYFQSLAALSDYASRPRPRRRTAPLSWIPSPAHEAQTLRDGRGKVAVCHDYKGGYVEQDGERGYTLQHWDKVDSFIYFSHNRVSLPPFGWIQAAHTAGAKVFGTLIFEWDAGKADIKELVCPGFSSLSSASSPSSAASNPFTRLSTRYADYLVDLAVERGFEGWLVNVEVELGIGKEGKWARAHALGLLEWLRYLREEMHKRVNGGEVMWYDAVTTEGKLQWQNRLSSMNLPYLLAADSLFVNYWWRPDSLASSSALLSSLQLPLSRRSDIFFGIDVFGRGSYGGGGFESWRALQAIQSATPPNEPGFSTALFAPGWTVEAESLQHSLTSPAAYARWLADDTYVWSHGEPTASVEIERKRLDKERKEQRGVVRARQLAASLAPAASPLPLPFRFLPPFSYQAPLDPFPGDGPFRPLGALLPLRPTPCPSFAFYTNFSTGTGNAFFVEGEKVLGGETAPHGTGWTDVAFSFPQPSLVFHRITAAQRERNGVQAEMVEDEAWDGPRALKLSVGEQTGEESGAEKADGEKRATVPLCSLELPLPAGDEQRELCLSVVWKRRNGEKAGKAGRVVPLLQAADGDSLAASVELVCGSIGDSEAANGWTRTTSNVVFTASSAPSASSAVLTLSVDVPSPFSLLISSLSVAPSAAPTTARPVLGNLRYSPSSRALEWDVDLAVPSPSPHATATTCPTSPPPPFSFFHLFLRHLPVAQPEKGAEVYLGTTFSRDFPIEAGRLTAQEKGDIVEVVVKGVAADGHIGGEADGAICRCRIDERWLP